MKAVILDLPKTKILIVDDEFINRTALKLQLKPCPWVEIVGECSNGLEAISCSEEMKPDVVLMDVTMPVLDGISSTKAIKNKNPEVKILMLTCTLGERVINEAFEAGASGFCSKSATLEKLLNAIQTVLSGDVTIDLESN